MRQSSTVAAITAIAIAIVGLQYWNSQRTPSGALPPLARNLPADIRMADHVFKQRLHDRFPIGTSNQAVVEELSTEGFRTENGRGGWRSASLKRSIHPCDIVWSVRWHLDAADKITATDGAYGLNCP